MQRIEILLVPDEEILEKERKTRKLLQKLESREELSLEDIGLKEIESKLKGLNKELEELIEAVRMFRQKLKEIL